MGEDWFILDPVIPMWSMVTQSHYISIPWWELW